VVGGQKNIKLPATTHVAESFFVDYQLLTGP
jgi:hypothetical protein